MPVEPGDVFLLCSDGLSGPVEDPELGAFAANFHPKDACRYLLQLANLRGGPDNITVVIARIGPWIEPDTDADVPKIDGSREVNGKKGGWMKGFAGLLGSKKKSAHPEVEEHLYRSSDCPITEELVDRMAELVRKLQQLAIEQTWPVDWTALASYRRLAGDLRSQQKLRSALKPLGEAIDLLGQAGRIHRKLGSANAG